MGVIMIKAATKTAPAPEVGMGATMAVGSDRYAYTVVEVISEKKILVVRDEVVYASDGSGYGESYSPGSGGAVLVSLCRDGRWHEGTTQKGNFFSLGVRAAYCDPHF